MKRIKNNNYNHSHQVISYIILVFISLLIFGACSQADPAPLGSSGVDPDQMKTLATGTVQILPNEPSNQVFESPVTYIQLNGPAALTQAEFSGMANYQDQLVLLPQYPQRMGEHEGGALFAIPHQTIIDYIQGISKQSITPRQVLLVSNGLENQISQFEGFEAIAFHGNTAYFTIEARQGLEMMGYLVSGQVIGNLEEIHLDLTSLKKNPPQVNQSNRTDEAIVIIEDRLLTFFESNGAQANPRNYVSLFDLNLNPQGDLSMPSIEYRLTDASEIDSQGCFWMINYFFPGDTDLLPLVDPIRERLGAGASHSQSETVERLLEFQYSESGISLTDTAPIQLQLSKDGESRNWEGLVRLRDIGFLIVTDKFPVTILGFVPFQ